MAANSRFAVATHLLTCLALASTGRPEGEPITSEWLAGSVNTNPIVVRRILGMLREAGLVRAQPGRNGGSTLARRPEQITLLDVYRAVDEPVLFALNPNRPNPSCSVSCRMRELLDPVFEGARQAVEAQLRRVRLSDLVAKLG